MRWRKRRGWLGAYHRNTQIEEELQVIGHGRIWPFYVGKSPQDSGAHAFATACHLLNIIVSIYISSESILKIGRIISLGTASLSHFTQVLIDIITIRIVFGAFLYNSVFIKKNISTRGFYKLLAHNYEEACQKVQNEQVKKEQERRSKSRNIF